MVECCYAVTFMLTVAYAECHKLALMLSFIMLNVIILSVAMLNVVAPLLLIRGLMDAIHKSALTAVSMVLAKIHLNSAYISQNAVKSA
jgi:hypothetical protein